MSRSRNSRNSHRELLVSPTRRVLLALLRDVETTTVPVAAERLAAADATRADDPVQFEARLRYLHLPELVGAGLVDYDSGSGTIRLADAGAASGIGGLDGPDRG